MKSIKSAIIDPLTVTINQIFKTGTFPDKLKIVKGIPLYKKQDGTVFFNYHPTSLLPAISNVFEKVVFVQLYEYIQINNLFYENQYGFREGHSIEFAALEIVDRVLQGMDKGEIPSIIYLDLSKAFAFFDHSILKQNLNTMASNIMNLDC